MSEAFRISHDAGGAATLILVRPEDGNRLNLPQISALAKAISDAGLRRDVKLIVLRAEGPDFCLGRAAAPAGAAPKSALNVRDDITQPILDVYSAIRGAPVPVLAAVQGRASGFGCALVAQCDLAIASDDATFSLPEMDHDLPPTLAMSALMHKVPPKRMLHLVYTRESVNATEAQHLGIVGRVVPAARLDAAVRETVALLAARKRAAICAVKEYSQTAPYADSNGAARLAANLLATVLSSPAEPEQQVQ